MRCHYCETENSEGRLFCSCCGTRLEERVQPDTVPVIPAEEGAQSDEGVEAVVAAVQAIAVQAIGRQESDWEERDGLHPAMQDVPSIRLPEKRGLVKMVFLGILTLGIYPTVIWSRIVTELNLAASRYDGKRSMPYFAMLLLVPLTLGIYGMVWTHKLCGRIGRELSRRELDYRFGARDFWLWNVLGCLILVGPFVFVHKLMKAMNQINADFNLRG